MAPELLQCNSYHNLLVKAISRPGLNDRELDHQFWIGALKQFVIIFNLSQYCETYELFPIKIFSISFFWSFYNIIIH